MRPERPQTGRRHEGECDIGENVLRERARLQRDRLRGGAPWSLCRESIKRVCAVTHYAATTDTTLLVTSADSPKPRGRTVRDRKAASAPCPRFPSSEALAILRSGIKTAF